MCAATPSGWSADWANGTVSSPCLTCARLLIKRCWWRSGGRSKRGGGPSTGRRSPRLRPRKHRSDHGPRGQTSRPRTSARGSISSFPAQKVRCLTDRLVETLAESRPAGIRCAGGSRGCRQAPVESRPVPSIPQEYNRHMPVHLSPVGPDTVARPGIFLTTGQPEKRERSSPFSGHNIRLPCQERLGDA
jgi:hypothetical protein